MSMKSKATIPQALPETLVDELALALAPIAPAPARSAALKERIAARVGRERRRFVTVRAADGSWQPVAPGIAIKVLDDDGSMQAFLLRLDPGARLPAHVHASDELCVVLEGALRMGDISIGAGDYHLALAGSGHDDIVSEGGALVFVRTAAGPLPVAHG